MTGFKALLVSAASIESEGTENESTEKKAYNKVISERQREDLPKGDVLIRVNYSSLNYKDGLSASGNKGVTKCFPHVPGIDAAGVVEESLHTDFAVGDKVLVTGYDLGMNTSGGYSEYIRVPANWVVRLPEQLSLKEVMAWGTAGLTAAICVDSLLQVGIQSNQGEVLVTGASGGVGSIACMILVNLGFDVVAGTGKTDQKEFFEKIGVKKFLTREEMVAGSERPMLKERWAAAIDTVGGDILFNAVKSTQYGGSVACCGMAASPHFQANVFPFILRGVNLLGVDSVELPIEVKRYMWETIATEWKSDKIWGLNQEITLLDLPQKLEEVLQSTIVGHCYVRVSGDLS